MMVWFVAILYKAQINSVLLIDNMKTEETQWLAASLYSSEMNMKAKYIIIWQINCCYLTIRAILSHGQFGRQRSSYMGKQLLPVPWLPSYNCSEA